MAVNGPSGGSSPIKNYENTCDLEPTDILILSSLLQGFHCKNEHVEYSRTLRLQILDLAPVLASVVRTYNRVKRGGSALRYDGIRERRFSTLNPLGILDGNTLRVV